MFHSPPVIGPGAGEAEEQSGVLIGQYLTPEASDWSVKLHGPEAEATLPINNKLQREARKRID